MICLICYLCCIDYKHRQDGMYGGPTYLLSPLLGIGIAAEIEVCLVSAKAISELCV